MALGGAMWPGFPHAKAQIQNNRGQKRQKSGQEDGRKKAVIPKNQQHGEGNHKYHRAKNQRRRDFARVVMGHIHFPHVKPFLSLT
jgi:hypothetical protein